VKDIALRAINDLTKKHNPEFIILYGSIVRGDYTDVSDIDIACFCKEPAVTKDVRLFEGKKLDCWVYKTEEINPNKKGFLRFVGGEVFLDENGIGKQFVSELTDFYNAGPEKIKQDASNHLIEWSKNMLVRASGDTIEAKYRKTSLPCALLEIYFELRNMWYLGSKQSFVWLQENDHSTFDLFEKSFSDPLDISILEKLVSATINTEQKQAMDA
jgi:predicted nucleotidyltransferase